MLRFRTLAAVGAAAVTLTGAALVAGPGSPASAAGDPAIGKQVLDLLCTANGGAPFFTPMTISRCQEARGQGRIRDRAADLRRPPREELRERVESRPAQPGQLVLLPRPGRSLTVVRTG